jgi:signal transduction histidine kinase
MDDELRALLDAAAEALLVIDGDGSIRVANARAEARFGRGTGELVGMPVDQVVIPDDLVRAGTRLKRQLLANMSHELRTPLNSIIGFAELIHRGRAGGLSEEQREYMGDILASARRLLVLVNNVLDLARVEAGNVELVPERVELAQAIGEVRDVLRGLATAKHHRLAIEVDPAAAELVVDPARLKQVVYNYLSNAIRFTPDGGRLTVRTAPAADPGELRVEVVDTGPGIAAAELPRLFVEFQQLGERSDQRDHHGSGLGLAITRRVVERLGGRVEVTSEVGRGSTFAAVLPRLPRAATPSG